MKRVLSAVIFLLLASPSMADNATDQAFRNLADEYISDLANFSPVSATLIGDHSADHKLDQVDAAGRARLRRSIRMPCPAPTR